MSRPDAVSLLLIITAAVVAVLLTDSLRRVRVPLVIVEIGIGMILGPQGLGLVQVTRLVALAAQIGVTCLFFLIGYEIRLSRLRGRPLTLGVTGWFISFTLAGGVGLALHAAGLGGAALPVGLAVSTTALGILLPVLRDAGILRSHLGPYVVAAGSAAQFIPIVCLTLLFGHEPLRMSLSLVLFLGIVTATAALLLRLRPARLARLLERTMHSSGQLPLRVCVLGTAVLVFFAAQLGLSALLAAFTLGLVVRAAVPERASVAIRYQLDAVGFGLFIPMFFVVTGVRFDLRALASSPTTPVVVLAAVALFLLVRGLPAALLYARMLGRRERAALACFSATQLPLVLVITSAAVANGSMSAYAASVLVSAGMVSVFAFPLLGLRLLPATDLVPESPSPGDPPRRPIRVAPSQVALTAAVPENASKEER
jgi:Kef-type K+ transport system membrane component KefB